MIQVGFVVLICHFCGLGFFVWLVLVAFWGGDGGVVVCFFCSSPQIVFLKRKMVLRNYSPISITLYFFGWGLQGSMLVAKSEER